MYIVKVKIINVLTYYYLSIDFSKKKWEITKCFNKSGHDDIARHVTYKSRSGLKSVLRSSERPFFSNLLVLKRTGI